jgi:type VI secretion system protein ImpL
MRTVLPWLIIGLSVLGGIGLFVYNWLRPDEEEEGEGEGYEGGDTLMITAAEGKKDDLATTTEEYRGSARKSRMIALKESLEKSLDSREGTQVSSAKSRMSMPWFLLVGADGSGKKTILANTGLPLPYGPPMEVDSHRKDAGRWWLFDDAVVLEAPAAAPGTTAGTTTLPPGQTVADTSVGWNTLLHMLRRERPDSPLNGLIVTISAADLISARANPERLTEQADRIRNFFERTRRVLGVRLPLHILVSKCDTLPGFRAFAETLPESRRHDIFGWANPAPLETKFDPTWIDKGFGELQQSLSDLRDELLAAPEHVRDSVGVFVFDSEFTDLQEPLKDFVSKLMTEGERRPSLFFRGIYFTGDMIDQGVHATGANTPPEGGTVRISAEIASAADEPHNLVFLRSLFADKIFKEAGLARPTARFRLAPDRRVVAAQIAALLLLFVGSWGLWTSVYGYKRDNKIVRSGLASDAQVLTRVLSGLAIDLDQIKREPAGPESPVERRSRDAAVIELVGQFHDVPTTRVRSPFLPTSWLSRLPSDITRSMMAGVQNIVLPVTRQRLQERANRLLGVRGAPETATEGDLDVADPRSLTNYLADVRLLSRNIARYNSLAGPTTGTVSELSALLDYLFGEQIATDSGLATADFERALRLAAGPGINVSSDMAGAVVNRAVAMVASVAGSASRQLAPRTTPQAERAVKPEEDLAALQGLAALVDLLDPKRGLVARISDTEILGAKLARTIEDSIAAQLRLAAVQISRDTLAPEDAARRLRTVIGQLFQYRLMDRTSGRLISSDIRPNERLRWDVGLLELALSLRGEFLQAVVTIADAFPGQPPDRMRKALEVQLRSRAIDVAANAQRFTPLGSIPDPMLEIRTQMANLEAAEPRILRLSILLDTLRASSEGKRLVAAAAAQAEQALAMAQAVFDRQRYFAPQTGRIMAWQGVIPFKLAALGVNDTLSFEGTLLRAETDIRTLAHDIPPALRYLRLPGVADSTRAQRLISDWEAIAAAAAKYERGDASSTLGMLHRYLRDVLAFSDLETCRVLAAQPDSIKASTDIFVIRRRQFRAAVASRCGVGAVTDALNGYQKLRTLFQSRLAGRYPFTDSTQRMRLPEADPAAVREFLRQYDAFAISGDIALRSNPGLVIVGRTAIAFLDQVGQVRAFMSPLVDNPRSPPTYSLLVGPRKDDGTGAQLELQVGGRALPVEDAEIDESWRYGDSVKVVTPQLDTIGTKTVFATAGGWSLLRFVQQRAADVPIRFFHPETKTELKLPVFPTIAPEIIAPRPR